MTLFDYLKPAVRERGWTIPQFARACGVSGQLAYKWLAEDPEQRIVPSPRSCDKIAAALGLDPDYVLELAGHRMPAVPSVRPTRLAAFLAQVEAAFHVYSEQEWEVREKAGRALFSVPSGQHGVSASQQGGFSPTGRAQKGHKRGSNGGLRGTLPRFSFPPRQFAMAR